MTVSSTISVFCRDGVFRTVYCHLHGEPTWNGRILHTHYATGQQAEALVEHGDIRCLGPRCDKPRWRHGTARCRRTCDYGGFGNVCCCTCCIRWNLA